MNKLKKGDMFVVYNSELKYVDLSRSGAFIVNNINNLQEYKFPLITLLCVYLGNNICEEYFSHIKMQINNPVIDPDKEYYVSRYAKHNSFRIHSNIIEKANSFNNLEKFILDYPLVVEPICIHSINQYYVCKNSSRKNTINIMKKLDKMAKIEYLESKKRYIYSEYDKAFVDNMVMEFEKRLVK